MFCKINPIVFKTVISNLVNNAVNAINKDKGLIAISLSNIAPNWLRIEIADNGKGFSEQILKKLENYNVNIEQEKDIKIGLRSAITYIKAWNGTYKVYTESGIGSKFIISLPIVEAPSWFCENIAVKPSLNIVIFSSDQSVYEIWENKFNFYTRQDKDIHLIECYTAQEIYAYLRRRRVKEMRNNLYLVDYELPALKVNGLEIIKQFDISPYAILVTSHSEDQRLKDQCLELGIKMIPKNYMRFIHIE